MADMLMLFWQLLSNLQACTDVNFNEYEDLLYSISYLLLHYLPLVCFVIRGMKTYHVYITNKNYFL